MKPRIIIKQKLPADNPPHPEMSPIQIHYDYDLGWIVEKVSDGEYEVLEFPYTGHINEEPNISLAIEESQGREIWICPKVNF